MSHQAVTRGDLSEMLCGQPASLLSSVLTAGAVAHDGPEEGSTALAKRLVDALWWRTHSPARQWVAPQTLDAVVDRVEKRLGLERTDGHVYGRLDQLTRLLLDGREPKSVSELPPNVVSKLKRGVWGSLFGTGAAGTAAGARFASLKLLGVASGPAWRVATLVPKVGPILLGLRAGVGTVAMVSGPLGILMALTTLNNVLGPTDDKALPLLLGVGLLCREPLAIEALPPQGRAD